MVSDKKGWTHRYMMEGISWANLQLYLADQVRLLKRSEIIQRVSKEDIKKHRERYNNG